MDTLLLNSTLSFKKKSENCYKFECLVYGELIWSLDKIEQLIFYETFGNVDILEHQLIKQGSSQNTVRGSRKSERERQEEKEGEREER